MRILSNLIVEVGGSNAAERILQDSATVREALASEWLSAFQIGVELGAQPWGAITPLANYAVRTSF